MIPTYKKEKSESGNTEHKPRKEKKTFITNFYNNIYKGITVIVVVCIT